MLISSSLAVLITKFLISLDERKVRSLIVLLISLTCILTSTAQFIIESDLTIISTIYLSTMTIISVFSITSYIFYLIHFFSFESPKRLLFGVIFFIITGFLFILLHVEILWDQYMSLLTHVSIQIISAVILILGYEVSHIKKKTMDKIRELDFNKSLGYFFIFNLLLCGISLSVISLTQRVDSTYDGDLTFMIWNVHNAIGDDDIFDLDRIVSDIKENDPDILGLNEVDLGAIKTASVDLPSYFAHKL